jgi:hypothetical protein
MNSMPADTLHRHQEFWARQPADRPLLGINVGFAVEDTFPRTMARIADGPLKPGDIPVDEFLQDCDALAQAHEGLGDYPYVAAPFVGVPWLEAIAGCPIQASRNSFWAEACVQDWRSWRWRESFVDNPWTQKLLELMEALVAHAAGRYQVAPTLMRGPADILSAMRGGAPYVMDLVDTPEAIGPAIDEAARLWSVVAELQLARIPQTAGGYVAGAAALRTWAPDKVLWLQEDAMSLLSPKLYRKHFLPVDRRLSDSFPCVAFHLHGSALWAIDDLIQVPGIDVLELNLEDARCDVEGTFAGWRKIQQHKPVVLWRMYAADFEDWLNRVLRELPRAGVSVQVSAHDLAEAQTAQAIFARAVEKAGQAHAKDETP